MTNKGGGKVTAFYYCAYGFAVSDGSPFFLDGGN